MGIINSKEEIQIANKHMKGNQITTNHGNTY